MAKTFEIDVDAMIENQKKLDDAMVNELIEIAQRVQNEVNSDNFDTVFNAIVAVIHAREIERRGVKAYLGPSYS